MLTRVFASLGRRVGRHPRLTLLIWLVLALLCFGLAVTGAGGETLFNRLTSGAPAVPGSDSEKAQEILAATKTTGESLTLALDGVSATDEKVAAVLAPVQGEIAAIPGVAGFIDPFVLPDGAANPAAAPLISAKGAGFLVVVTLEPDLSASAEETALAAVRERLDEIPGQLRTVAPGATGIVGGTPLIVEEITGQVEKDLVTGETIALPIALLVMVLVFGGFLAASMPLIGAIASIAGGLGALLGFSYVMDLEASVVNVVTILGLGLSIDYGLLIVSRYREELTTLVARDDGAGSRRRRGDGAVTTALVRTMQTAGRTVSFSALTVAIAIGGLLAFRPGILRAFGLAGITVVLIALASSLTLVPALLVLFGRRLVRPGLVSRVKALGWLLRRTADVHSEEGWFSSLTGRVQRRPVLVMCGVLVLLGVLAVPLTHLELRNSTLELLPAGSTQREFVQTLASDYPGSSSAPVLVVAETTLAKATEWVGGLGTLEDVVSVDAPQPRANYVIIGVHPDSDAAGDKVERRVVSELRSTHAPFPTWVTGSGAVQIDFTGALMDGAPLAIGIVALATLVLLFLMTGSVLIPVKALLTNAISLAASLGVLVWAFQDGHLSGLLQFISVGGIETYVLVMVIAFAFGLAMDYEVFLLSRIKELHDAGYSDNESVRLGLQRSGRIITSAAAIIIVVFAGFVFGKLLVIKEVGFALAIAVLIDATLVRMLLVPATMTLLGKWNWWAPAPLRRVYERIGITH